MVNSEWLRVGDDSVRISCSDSLVLEIKNQEEMIFLKDSIAPRRITEEKLKKRKRIIAALLAFPFPFGIIGLHRIYLGTKPFIPLVYIATLGGCVGILPLIDFFVLLTKKEVDPYLNNEQVFMWVK